ncbi:nitroreductase family protein [Acinetobacter sp. SwsAc7]|nr:nitroreductase family protein [Acinetobacter sp. SwsAc7]
MSSFLLKYIPLVIKNNIKLILDYLFDYLLFYKNSTVFSVNNFENKETILILNYHGIEKGLLHKKIKPRFAKDRIQEMHKLLKDDQIIKNVSISQIFIGYKVAMEYYELHKELEIDISDYFTENQYLFYRNLTKDIDSHDFISGVHKISFEEFYTKHDDFYNFSNSRKSVRYFTGEKIGIDKIKNIIKLANNSPSVCNRQASKVYLLEDKDRIDECLKIQGGFNGFTEKVNQLLILTVDRKYFYITGERYQFYIDGGIYLMNLLYSLHFYKVAACPANWGKDYISDNQVRKFVNIPQEEQIICMIPIGMATDEIAVTLSYRRTVDEVLKII